MAKTLKVTDIHPQGISEEFDKLMLTDIQRLLQQKHDFIDTCCPACHGANVYKAFEYQSMEYKRCIDCETLYISPGPSEDQHLNFIRESSAMAFWRENLPEDMKVSRRPMYQERLTFAQDVWREMNINPNDIIELGAGNGEFADELCGCNEVKNLVLLEPQALKVQRSNVEVITDGFDALEKSERKFDTVFAWELIEHLLEPDNFLRLVKNILKPGSPLILSTPNERSVETRKLGTASTNILFDHVRLYNPISINTLLERNGFKVIRVCTPGQLDVNRLQNFYKTNPKSFASDPSLELILTNDKACIEYQKFLQENLLSSHMRVVAIPSGEWSGSLVPRVT